MSTDVDDAQLVERTRDWGRKVGASPAPGPVQRLGHAPSPGHAIPPDRYLRPAVMAQARSALGDRFERAVLVSRDRVSVTNPGGWMGAGTPIENHTTRALLSRVAAGSPVDMDEVRGEVGALVLRDWFDVVGGSLAKLTAAVVDYLEGQLRRIKHIDGQLEYHGAVLSRGGSLHDYAISVGPEVEERSSLLARAVEVNASLNGLRPAVAKMVTSAVEAAEGAAHVAILVRQQIMGRGAWPGRDARLEEMERRSQELDRKMQRYQSADPDLPEVPEASSIREELKSLVDMIADRRCAVEHAAIGRIELMIADASSGDHVALAELTEHVNAAPGTFPGGFAGALRRIPLAAALEAGPAGFLHAL